jgi:hypothetical protein
MTVVLTGCHFGTAASDIVKWHCCLHSLIDEAWLFMSVFLSV